MADYSGEDQDDVADLHDTIPRALASMDSS
jgi:hypothetical protein